MEKAMWTKEELKNLFEDAIKRYDEETDDCQRQLTELRKKMDEVSDERYYREYQATKSNLINALDNRGKELYDTREKLSKKKSRAKWWGVPLLLLYLFLAYRFLFVFNPDFSAPDITVYAITIGIAIVIYFVPVLIRKVVLSVQIASIKREPQIQELDKKTTEALKDYYKNVSNNKNTYKGHENV